VGGKFEGGRGPGFSLVRGSWEALVPRLIKAPLGVEHSGTTLPQAQPIPFQHLAQYYDFGTRRAGACLLFAYPLLVPPLVCH
jgi:hypothetical protein